MIALRRSQPVLRRRTFLNGQTPGSADVLWLRPDANEMTEADWSDPNRRTLGVLLDGQAIQERSERGERIVGDTLLILFNAGPDDVAYTLPTKPGTQWERLIDTAETDAADTTVDAGSTWMLGKHSSVVFRSANREVMFG